MTSFTDPDDITRNIDWDTTNDDEKQMLCDRFRSIIVNAQMTALRKGDTFDALAEEENLIPEVVREWEKARISCQDKDNWILHPLYGTYVNWTGTTNASKTIIVNEYIHMGLQLPPRLAEWQENEKKKKDRLGDAILTIDPEAELSITHHQNLAKDAFRRCEEQVQQLRQVWEAILDKKSPHYKRRHFAQLFVECTQSFADGCRHNAAAVSKEEGVRVINESKFQSFSASVKYQQGLELRELEALRTKHTALHQDRFYSSMNGLERQKQRLHHERETLMRSIHNTREVDVVPNIGFNWRSLSSMNATVLDAAQVLYYSEVILPLLTDAMKDNRYASRIKDYLAKNNRVELEKIDVQGLTVLLNQCGIKQPSDYYNQLGFLCDLRANFVEHQRELDLNWVRELSTNASLAQMQASQQALNQRSMKSRASAASSADRTTRSNLAPIKEKEKPDEVEEKSQ
jgi:hypothetical protein